MFAVVCEKVFTCFVFPFVKKMDECWKAVKLTVMLGRFGLLVTSSIWPYNT